MNARYITVLLALALLLVGSVLLGWAAEQVSALAMPAAGGVAAGGDYRVTVESAPAPRVMVRQVSGAVLGGHYRIEPATGTWAAATAPVSSEAGCCCIYLPCIRR
jgi:hypothetical protein